jgi:hypothetical protein
MSGIVIYSSFFPNEEQLVFYCGEGPGNVWGGIVLIIK